MPICISLRPLTAENWNECIELTVTDEQLEGDFVAPNLYSIGETRFLPLAVPRVIYYDETMVGFVMYDESDYEILRLMIDQRYQGRGYGRAALQMIVERMERGYIHPLATICYAPANDVAARLYASLGFEDTGEIKDGEVVRCRVLTRSPAPAA